MLRAFVIAGLLALAALHLPAAFAGGAPAAKPAAESDDPKRQPGAPFVDLPPFMAPVTVNGELKFYMYMVIKVDLTSDFKKPIVLEKVPYLQDAFLRAVHKTSIASAEDPTKVDEPALLARLKTIADQILGPGVVQQLSFRNLARAAH